MVGDRKRRELAETIKGAGVRLGNAIGLSAALTGLALAIGLLALVIAIKALRAA